MGTSLLKRSGVRKPIKLNAGVSAINIEKIIESTRTFQIPASDKAGMYLSGKC
jgi:hypothetical protein